MSRWPFTRGVHDLGRGLWAYLQPTGTWGWSNAGLVTDGDEALLVDTLFDERLTAEMLHALKNATGFGADDIGTLVNTHSNGDHTFGNRLARKAVIVASAATAHEMAHEAPPAMLAELMKNAASMGKVGEFFQRIFGAFDFAGVTLRLPDRTFSGEERVLVGDKEVHLIEVGPAHTAGDVIVHVPADRVLFTGDILFVDGAPIAWAGPVARWIAACDRILAMDVEVIVPGHGPICEKTAVRRMRDYLAHVEREARKRHAAGLSSWEAAQEIALDSFASLPDGERIAVTVDTIYREIEADESPRDVVELFGRMVRLEARFAAAARPAT
ncbi:MAG: MBL fold metallo-hydrolase [Candidatus Binatia bacterium]